MFTGIIQGTGRIKSVRSTGDEYTLTVDADFDWSEPLVMGESIAVSGACLTVVQARDRAFDAHVSAETISRTTMREAHPGDKVNLERALKLSDRLGGHLVTGHIDGLGRIKDIRERDRSLLFTIAVESRLERWIIEKGSIAIDGISLTVNQVVPQAFTVNLIPHTAAVTTLAFKKAGDYVNLETDLIGKYVARFLDNGTANLKAGSKIDEKFLAEHGFF